MIVHKFTCPRKSIPQIQCIRVAHISSGIHYIYTYEHKAWDYIQFCIQCFLCTFYNVLDVALSFTKTIKQTPLCLPRHLPTSLTSPFPPKKEAVTECDNLLHCNSSWWIRVQVYRDGYFIAQTKYARLANPHEFILGTAQYDGPIQFSCKQPSKVVVFYGEKVDSLLFIYISCNSNFFSFFRGPQTDHAVFSVVFLPLWSKIE